MNEQNKQRPEDVYQLLCDTLDKRKIRYEKSGGDLLVKFEMAGKSMPIRILMMVDKERSLLKLLSPLPFAVPENKRLDMSLAVNALNNQLPEGNFDYEYASGRLCFRIASCFKDCEIAAAVPEYLLFLAGVVVDRFNDKLRMFSEGAVSLEQLMNGKDK